MTRTQRSRTIVLLLGIVAIGLPAKTLAAGESGSATLTTTRYIEHVRFLAHDRLGGRQPGTEGIARAAEYIAEQFRAAGLEPAGDDGTFFQWFELPGSKAFEPEAASFTIAGGARSFEAGRDWVPLPFTKPGAFEGPVAFAGYGIEAGEFGYNDYDGFDAEGKVLIILRYEPKADDPEARFGGRTHSRHSYFIRKARVARQHGAVALLIVNPPSHAEKDELYRWRPVRQTYAVPMLHISRRMADTLLAAGGLPSIEELDRRIVETRRPIARDLTGVSVRVETGVKQKPLRVRNVVGRLPGHQAPDEYIVIGGHYDHVGTDSRGIHNGADDNASGTAGVIELARVLAADRPLRRSILFIAFTAEEMGLLGSAHFVEDPVVPLEQIRAMINLDMIGRLRHDHLTLFGVPTADEFPRLVAAAAEDAGLTCDTPPTESRLFGASDHMSFYRKNIPVLFAFTGMHRQYHRPPDDWERINPAGAVRVLTMIRELATSLADMTEGPHFAQPAQATFEEAEAPGMPDVRLGFAPDPQDDGPGVLLSEVVPDGPCDQAGLKPGDRIIRIDGRKLRNLVHYMTIAHQHKPGDEITCVVRRGDRELTVKLRFAPAP